MSLSLNLPNATYVVAVSGGVDSVVLLELLTKTNSKLVVAHFDHGIRHNSHEDAEFVMNLAEKYGLPFELERVELGKDTSEAEARKARYGFLNGLREKYKATAVVTAHHQDDLIETSMINLLRGTGRHGLTSLKSKPGLLRPFISIPKKMLIDFANENRLEWREDESNKDTKYLRNKIRLEVLPKMSDEIRAHWLKIIEDMQIINKKLDAELQTILRRGLHKGQPILNRQWFINLPHAISKEAMLYILRDLKVHDIDRKTIERLSVQIKTVKPGKMLQAHGVKIELTKRSARFVVNKAN